MLVCPEGSLFALPAWAELLESFANEIHAWLICISQPRWITKHRGVAWLMHLCTWRGAKMHLEQSGQRKDPIFFDSSMCI